MSDESGRGGPHDSCVSELTVQIPDDGYDIEVVVQAGAIKRALARAEAEPTQEYARNGPLALDLSRFASVNAEPTEEKWGELLDDDE